VPGALGMGFIDVCAIGKGLRCSHYQCGCQADQCFFHDEYSLCKEEGIFQEISPIIEPAMLLYSGISCQRLCMNDALPLTKSNKANKY